MSLWRQSSEEQFLSRALGWCLQGIIVLPNRTIPIVIDPAYTKVGNHGLQSLIHRKIPHERASVRIAFSTHSRLIDFLLIKQIAESATLDRIPQVMRGGL